MGCSWRFLVLFERKTSFKQTIILETCFHIFEKTPHTDNLHMWRQYCDCDLFKYMPSDIVYLYICIVHEYRNIAIAMAPVLFWKISSHTRTGYQVSSTSGACVGVCQDRFHNLGPWGWEAANQDSQDNGGCLLGPGWRKKLDTLILSWHCWMHCYCWIVWFDSTALDFQGVDYVISRPHLRVAAMRLVRPDNQGSQGKDGCGYIFILGRLRPGKTWWLDAQWFNY